MPYVIPNLSKIREDILRDIKNQLPHADIGVDSDYYVRASSVASAAEGLYHHQSWITKQIFPDTADTEFLEWHCAVRGISRKPATYAQGTATVTGVVNTVLVAGSIIKTETNVRYIVQETSSIPLGGELIIDVQAAEPGTSSNIVNGVGNFIQIDSGINSQVTALNVHGGVEQETDVELLARLLDLLRRPPAGGNQYDYKKWAMSVPGVSNAFVYPLRRGLGTVDIVIISGQDIPSAETLEAVQNYIDDVRPVTAKGALVIAPTRKLVNISMQVRLKDIEQSRFEEQVTIGLQQLFAGLIPGESLVKSKVEALISNMPMVEDRVLITPTSNIDADVNENIVEWISLGDIEVTPL